MEKKGKIVVVDDESEILETLQVLLESPEYDVITATNGEELIQLVENKRDILTILSDIHMPIIGGIEALQILRQKGLNIPVIFLTGYGSKETVVEALRLGAFDFIDKPFDYALLRDLVTKAVELGISLKKAEEEFKDFKLKYKDIDEKDLKTKKILLEMKAKNKALFKK